MSNFYNDVRDFHIAFSQPVGDSPNLPDENERHLRKILLQEEVDEYL